MWEAIMGFSSTVWTALKFARDYSVVKVFQQYCQEYYAVKVGGKGKAALHWAKLRSGCGAAYSLIATLCHLTSVHP